MPHPEKFSEPRSDEKNFFGLLGGLGHAPPEIFLNKGSEIG